MDQEWIDYIDALPECTPVALFEAAKSDKKCPFRQEFEWDKNSGWQKYNIEIARKILRRKVQVIVRDEEITIPAYVRDPSKEHADQGYVKTETLRLPSEQERRSAAIAADISAALDRLRRVEMLQQYLGDVDNDARDKLKVASHLSAKLLQVAHEQPSAAQ